MRSLVKKKTRILALLLVITLAVVAFQLSRSPAKPAFPDPVFNGKSARVWARQFILDESYEAQNALQQIGAPAVPYLIPNLERRDSIFNSAYVKLWPVLPALLKSRLQPPLLSREARMRAVVAFREMGPSARQAVSALMERLRDKDATIRLHSAIALGNIGPDAKAAVPALKPFLKERHTVRVYTAIAIWKIEHNTPEALPVLEQGLQEENAKFRWAAAVFLGEMGPAAEHAIPLLEKATKAADKETASCAVQALAQISPGTVPILIETLKDPDPGMRISAAAALARLGAAATQAIPDLTALLKDPAMGSPTIMGRGFGQESVSHAAADAIAQIDPQAAAKAGAR